MRRKRVLFLCPTSWDHTLLARPAVTERYEIVLHGAYAAERPEEVDPVLFIEEAVARFRDAGLDGVVSTHDYPGSILAAAVAERLGLPSPSPRAMLWAQHKLHARRTHLAACPSAVPRFFEVDLDHPVVEDGPFFIRPAKSVMSILAQAVHSPAELELYLQQARPHLSRFAAPFNALWRAYDMPGRDASVLVGEELLTGVQVTVEGVRARGVTSLLGVVDSVMFPGTLSFSRFEHPSRLPEPVTRRMEEASARVVEALGLDDLCFNVELFYDPTTDRISIIEVNPRMSYQFADMFEKVDGVNTMDLQLRIATGEPVGWQRGGGAFGAAVSHVLRRFRDATIRRWPTAAEIEAARADFPDAHVWLFGQPGARLSDLNQDMQSFRYGIINAGGHDREDALGRCAALAARLPIGLEDSPRPGTALNHPETLHAPSQV